MKITNHRIPAIQTRYKGYHFRSRLEARWAVFFDSCGVGWEYEKEGYNLGADELSGGPELGCYLPDFWIPSASAWIEIKPDIPTNHWTWTEEEIKVWNLVLLTKAELGFVFYGLPSIDTKVSYIENGEPSVTLPKDPLRYDSPSYVLPWYAASEQFDEAKSARFEHGQRGAS